MPCKVKKSALAAWLVAPRDKTDAVACSAVLPFAGNRPYLQVKPLMADVQSLFAQTKKLHGKTSSQAEHIRSLQRLWLSQCSDRLEPCPQPKAEELHKAWHAAKAERKEPYMLTDAQQKLQQSVEDTSNSKSNKASAYIDAVRQAVYLLYVSADAQKWV